MRRRELLALTASAFAATAGCLGESGPAGDDSTPSETTTETPTGTETPADSVESVALDALQPGIIQLGTPDSIGVFGEREGQYLYLDVSPGADAPDPEAFAFELDGESHPPITEVRGLWRAYNAEEGAEYAPDDGGWLLFELPAPAEDPASARLTWPDGSWQPGDAVRQRLASPAPTFDVTVEVAETVPATETPTMTVTAENTGSVTSRFLLAINRVGPNVAYAPEAAVRTTLDPGEREEWTGEPSVSDPVEAGDTTELKFDWYGGDAEREVEFVAE